MARYVRRRSYRRRGRGGFRKRPTQGWGSTLWQGAKSGAWYLAKLAAMRVIKNYVNTERKYFDVAPSALAPGTTGVVQPLSLIPLGAGASQRDGRQVKAVSLDIRFVVQLHPTAVADAFRLILVRAKTDIAPTLTDIIVSANTLAPRNLDEVRDYEVMKETILNMDHDKNSILQFSWHLNMASKLQFAAADTAGQANPEWGHFYIMMIARENTYQSDCLLWSRLRYIDN